MISSQDHPGHSQEWLGHAPKHGLGYRVQRAHSGAGLDEPAGGAVAGRDSH